MRIGKPTLKARSWNRAGEYGKPHHVTSETIIGQVSLDLIRSIYAPEIQDIASLQMEQYATALLEYEDNQASLPHDPENETEILSNGSTTVARTVEPPTPPLFQSRVVLDEFVQLTNELSDHFMVPSGAGGGWKVQAKSAKFERLLDEKYGVFRPFMMQHPELERYVRSLQRKYATGYFSPFRQGDPPIPRSTAIVILFMMNRGGIRWEIMVLSSVFFLVGLQPWALVAIVSLLHSLLMRRKHRPISTMPSMIPTVEPYYATVTAQVTSTEQMTAKKNELLCTPVGELISHDDKLQIDTAAYDILLLGSGSPALYTAALLSRAGRRVLVLSTEKDASGCLTLEQCDSSLGRKYQSIPFDVTSSNIALISTQQSFLAPALCTSTDYQGGIRFAQIGSDSDGHAFEILSIPGVGTDRPNQSIPIVLRADGGATTLMNDAAAYLGDGWPDMDGTVGNSTVGAYIQHCQTMNGTSSQFYLSKILPESVHSLIKGSLYEECALRYASTFLDKSFPLNPHTRCLMAGIGMRGENIKPSQCSMAAHVSNVCGCMSGEGMYYPIGGPRALSKALAHVIECNGGRIVTGVPLKELLFDEEVDSTPTTETRNGSGSKSDDGPTPPRCVGVQLATGQQIRFAAERFRGSSSDPAVVSLQGFIETFLLLLPDAIRPKYKVPRGLPALSERRPVFKVLFAISGNAQELELTGADFYRLPNASIAPDKYDAIAGTVIQGEIGGHDDDGETNGKETESDNIVEQINNEDPSDQEAAIRTGSQRRKRDHKSKFHAGQSWVQISFPSAKDPTFVQRHSNVTTCVVTVEADDDFVTAFDTKPKMFAINKETASTPQEKQRLLDKVTKDLLDLYPQLEGNIEHSEVRGPFRRGLSHTPARYAAKGIRADTPYPRLFVGGSDLTAGDSFGAAVVGGWLVANAVIGYNVVDHLYLKKNITTDLDAFLEAPTVADEEDLAVPFEQRGSVEANDQ